MKKPKGCRAWRRSRRAGRPEAAMALEGRPLPCSPPASHSLRALFEALPRRSPAPRLCRHILEKSALRWRAGKSGRRRSIALQGFRWAFPRRVRNILEGRPLCRPTLAGRSPALFRSTRSKPARESHGADGAAPSMVFGSASPNQRVHLSLIWPILGSCHQAGPHGVFNHIPPLFVVAFLSS